MTPVDVYDTRDNAWRREMAEIVEKRFKEFLKTGDAFDFAIQMIDLGRYNDERAQIAVVKLREEIPKHIPIRQRIRFLKRKWKIWR